RPPQRGDLVRRQLEAGGLRESGHHRWGRRVRPARDAGARHPRDDRPVELPPVKLRGHRNDVVRVARRIRNRRLAALRLASYRGSAPAWIRVLPKRLRLAPPPPGERRLEFGSGWSPRPGYIHVD